VWNVWNWDDIGERFRAAKGTRLHLEAAVKAST
jgi:hypothetical protein